MAQNEVKIRLSVDGTQQAAGQVDRVGESLKKLNADTVAAAGGSGRLADAIGRVAHYGIAGGGIYAVAQAVTAVSRALFEASAQAQRLATQLNFATSGNGARELAFVSQVANRLGLELNSTAKAYAGFASAARGTSLEGQRARDVFESIAMASAVMGLSADESSGALLAVQQMMSKGVVSAEEFRGQLGERMPIALRAGAAALGVTEAAFSKMLETGQIVAADFLPKFGDAIRREIGQAADEAAGRLDASVARMGNAWTRLKQVVGDSGISKALAGGARLLANDMTAVSEAMDRAKASGSGFFGQVNAGLGQFIGRAVGLQLVNRDFLTLDQAVADATATIRRFDDQEKRDGKLSIYALARRAEAVRDLARANLELAASGGASQGAGAGRGNINPETIGETAARKAKDAEALNALRLKLAKVPEGYARDMQEVIRLNQLGVLVGKEYTDALASMQGQLVKGAAAGAGVNKDLAERIALMARLYGGPDGMQASVAVDLRRAEIAETDAVNARMLADTMAAQARATEAAAKARADLIKQLDTSADSVAAQVQKLQDEEQAAALAAARNISLAEAIELVAIARLQEQRGVQLSFGDEGAADAIQREIDGRRELAGLIAGREVRQAAADSAKEAAAEWKKAADSLNESLTDALYRAFEAGKGFGRTLRDSLVNTFKTMVLRPIISAIVSPISGAVSGAVGGALGLGAAGAAAGGLSAGAGAGIAGAGLLGGAVGAFGSGVASGLTAWGAGGSVTGLLGTGSALFSGGIASGLGTIAGALGPIALGAAAIYALAKSLDKGGTPHVGAAYTVGTDGRNGSLLTPGNAGGWQIGSTWSARGATSAAIQGTVQQFTASLAATMGAALQTFNLQPASVRAGFTADNDDPSAGRITIRGADGRLLTDLSKRYAASASKGFEEFAADAGKALRDALVAADLPGWADSLLADLGSRPTLEAVQTMVQSITQLRGVFSQLGSRMGVTEAQVVGLAQAFGGVDALAAGLSGYLSAAYSDSEKLTIAQRNLAAAFAQLGQAVPASTQAYRALVEAQDINTAAGRNAYAALLQLAPAFAEVSAAAEQAAAEQAARSEQAAQQAADAARRVLDERSSLEKQLLELQGNTLALREREIAALDPSNQALQRRIFALADEKRRIEALASAGQGISEFLRELSTVGGNGAQSLAALRAAYGGDLAAAQAGDAQASARLPASARGFLEAVRDNASTAVEVAQESSRIAVQLQALPASVAWQQSLAESMAAVQANTSAGGALAKAFDAASANVARGLIDSAAVRQVVFDASDPLRSIFNATRLAAEGTLDLLTKASNGTLGLYVSLSRNHNADGAMDIGVNMMRGWSSWGAAGIPIRSNGFAAGGMHAGGLRIVGENGPELEVTGPARIYSANQTARLLSGASDQSAMLAELQAQRSATARLEVELRSLNAAMQGLRMEAQAAAVNTNKSTRQLQEVIDRGVVVRTDADTPLATVAA